MKNFEENRNASNASLLSEGLGCPHCGCDEYYRKGRYSGNYEYRYRFDGKEADNSGLHDGAEYVENKTMFCAECHRKMMPNVK